MTIEIVMASVGLFLFSNTKFKIKNKIMIKANELRIGNFLEWNKGLFKCCQIFNNAVENELWCKPLNELHPIEITEQILVKFGFTKRQGNNICWDFGSFMVGWYGNNIATYIIGFEHNKNSLKFYSQIKYVHQLQNLYFALCGEELVFSSTEP